MTSCLTNRVQVHEVGVDFEGTMMVFATALYRIDTICSMEKDQARCH